MRLVTGGAIVTGGASGIGRGIAEELLDHGTPVLIADIDVETATETSSELDRRYDPEVVAVECDVTERTDVTAAVERASEAFGEIGILVNNAGGASLGRTWELPESEWDEVVDLCLKGTFLCTKAVIDHMLEHGIEGAIVNVSSLNYTAGTDGMAHYSAAKAGVCQFTEVVASEAGRYGIRVNAVAPGLTDTPATESLLQGKMAEAFLEHTALERDSDPFGTPEDVAKVVAFLVSEYSRWVTGETICVDGGQHTRGLHSYWDVLDEMGEV